MFSLSITLKWVIASLEFSLVTHIFFLLLTSLPIGASIVAVSSLIIPSTRAIYSLTTSFLAIASARILCALSFLATSNNPEVSASILWTIPGLIKVLIVLRFLVWYKRALTRVPSRLPGAGCTAIPLGLFTTIKSSSS